MNTENIFQRYEIKYLISTEQKLRLLEGMGRHIQEDRFSNYTICNIYFDTTSKYLIRRSLEKPVYKEKLRLRSYGTPAPDSIVFLELKKKYRDIVYKRRITLSEADAMTYLCQNGPLPEKSQISSEIDYFRNFYRDICPSVVLSYDREAYCGITQKDLRITFDQNILWRNHDFSLCSPIYGNEILAPGQTLMEIKVGEAMPLWLTHLLTENQIYKTSFSKYGCAYRQMMRLNGGQCYA